MAKLVNMKIDPAKAKDKYPETVAVDAPRYPYGLCLHLDDEVMEKLGLDELPQVGKPISLIAIANVASVTENQFTPPSGKATTRQSISLQITDLALGPPDEAAEKKLYKG